MSGRSKSARSHQNRNQVGHHDEWVRDVAYANTTLGVHYDRVVSGGEDNKVKIWKKEGEQGEWTLESEIIKDAPVWRVEFSPIGNLLSICCQCNPISAADAEG